MRNTLFGASNLFLLEDQLPITESMAAECGIQMTVLGAQWEWLEHYSEQQLVDIIKSIVPADNVKIWLRLRSGHMKKMRHDYTIPYQYTSAMHQGLPKPEYRKDWLEFISRVANAVVRAKGVDALKVVQINNEPGQMRFGADRRFGYNQFLGSPPEFAKLFTESVEELYKKFGFVKRAAPGDGLAAHLWPSPENEYHGEVLNNIASSIDMIDLHVYSDSVDKAMWNNIAGVIDETCKNRGIGYALTENNCALSIPGGIIYDSFVHWVTSVNEFTYEQIAQAILPTEHRLYPSLDNYYLRRELCANTFAERCEAFQDAYFIGWSGIAHRTPSYWHNSQSRKQAGEVPKCWRMFRHELQKRYGALYEYEEVFQIIGYSQQPVAKTLKGFIREDVGR